MASGAANRSKEPRSPPFEEARRRLGSFATSSLEDEVRFQLREDRLHLRDELELVELDELARVLAIIHDRLRARFVHLRKLQQGLLIRGVDVQLVLGERSRSEERRV